MGDLAGVPHSGGSAPGGDASRDVDSNPGGSAISDSAIDGTAPSVKSDELMQLVETVAHVAGNAGRTDLVQRLEQTHGRLLEPSVRVIIVGEFKQGKSKLVNALVNAPVCPIDDDVATSVPTAVGYGDQPAAWLVVPDGDGGQKVSGVKRQPIPIADLPQYVSELGNPTNQRGILAAEVLLPREILKGGLQLVDSPGVGGLDSAHALTTLSALASAHAVLLVSDASQEYTEPEMQLLKHALRISPNVAGVLAKTDLYPEWRTIERIDRDHLHDIGEVPLFAVSSDLRLLAAAEHSADLNDESGFPTLVAHLRRDVVERAELINVRGAVHDLSFVTDQLTVSLRSELSALTHPEDTPRLIAELETIKGRAEDFRSRSSRWQTTLNDGVTDLIADMEHDLRDRLRRVQREAEQAIDDGDPGPIWNQITEWTDQRVASAVSETFVWTDERSRWLAEEVAGLFLEGSGALPTIAVAATEDVLDPVEPLPGFDAGRMGAGEKIYIGVRGSYGGVLMMGLATGLIGLPLINPLSLLVGVLVGRRAYREDMSNRLMRRRFEAKNIIRRYIDEVIFQVGKELRDRLRLVQRTTRDHFGNIADELNRSLGEALQAARQAAGTFTEERDQRVVLLQRQLNQIEQLQARVPELPAIRVKEVAGR